MDAHRLPPLHLRRLTERTHVELAVQSSAGIVRDQLKRKSGSLFRSQPLHRFHPDRVPRTIVVAKRIDRLGEDFELSAWCAERRGLGIPAKLGECDEIVLDEI